MSEFKAPQYTRKVKGTYFYRGYRLQRDFSRPKGHPESWHCEKVLTARTFKELKDKVDKLIKDEKKI